MPTSPKQRKDGKVVYIPKSEREASESGKAGGGASQWEQTYKTTTVYGVTFEGFRLGNMEIQGSDGLYRVFDTSTKRGNKKPIRTLDTLRKAKSYAEKYSKEKNEQKNINSANKRAGRGASNFSLSDSEIKKINDNVKSHSKSDNDRAERNTYNALQREKSVVENLDKYIRLGHIKSANDEWFQGHIEAYNSLSAQLKEIQKARKRYNK